MCTGTNQRAVFEVRVLESSSLVESLETMVFNDVYSANLHKMSLYSELYEDA